MDPNTSDDYLSVELFEDQVTHWTPEHRLLIAILTQAISDATIDSVHVWFRKQARRWFAAEWLKRDLSPPYGTFQYVCSHLSSDPAGFRDKVMNRLESK